MHLRRSIRTLAAGWLCAMAGIFGTALAAPPLELVNPPFVEAAGKDVPWSGGAVAGTDGRMRFGVVKDPAGSGRMAYMHAVVRGDAKIYNGWRSEITLTGRNQDVVNGQDHWMAFAIYLSAQWPQGGAARADRVSVFQVHQRSDPCDNDNGVPLQLQSWGQDGTLHWIINSSPLDCSSEATNLQQDLHKEPLRLNQWIRYVVHYRPHWDFTQSPRLRVWRDGALIVDHQGPNAFRNAKPAWPKLGIYQWNDTWMPAERVMYSRGLHFGRGAELLDAATAALQ